MGDYKEADRCKISIHTKHTPETGDSRVAEEVLSHSPPTDLSLTSDQAVLIHASMLSVDHPLSSNPVLAAHAMYRDD